MSSNPTSITYNGLTINNAAGYTILGEEGLSLPPYRVSEDELTNQDGSVINGVLFGPRTIQFNGEIIGTDTDDFFSKRDAMVVALNKTATNRPLEITLWNNRTRTIQAIPVDAELKLEAGKTNLGTYRVQFRCSEVYFEDGTSTIVTIAAAVSGGVQIPTPIGTPLGSSTGQTSVNVTGAVEAEPTYTIRGPITNPTFSNVTTGESFTLSTTIAGGKYIEVSRSQGQLLVRDYAGVNQFSVFSGDYPTLQVGTNVLQLTGTGTDSNSEATITYKNRYLNI